MRRRSAAGFTLIEILIASSLLAVIGLAIAETLRAARDADRRVQVRSERRAHDHAVLTRIRRDLEAVLPSGGQYAAGIVGENNQRVGGHEILSLPDEEAAAQARADQLQAPVAPFIERDRLTLSVMPGARRFGSPWPAGTGSIQSIIWEVDDDPATLERGLVRRPTTITDAVTGASPEPVEIIGSNVVGLAFRYFDGTNWQLTWDSSSQQILPQAIEVALAVRDDDGTIRRVVTVVAPLTGRVSNAMTPTADK